MDFILMILIIIAYLPGLIIELTVITIIGLVMESNNKRKIKKSKKELRAAQNAVATKSRAQKSVSVPLTNPSSAYCGSSYSDPEEDSDEDEYWNWGSSSDTSGDNTWDWASSSDTSGDETWFFNGSGRPASFWDDEGNLGGGPFGGI